MYKISNADRAQVLIQALPYIQKYSGQTIVVKYGGNAMVTDYCCKIRRKRYGNT